MAVIVRYDKKNVAISRSTSCVVAQVFDKTFFFFTKPHELFVFVFTRIDLKCWSVSLRSSKASDIGQGTAPTSTH